MLDEYGVRRFPFAVEGKKVLVFNGIRYEFDGFFEGFPEGEPPQVSEAVMAGCHDRLGAV
ncbi:MAG: hypothetical protein WA939_24615 [Nodosilinea sp.]